MPNTYREITGNHQQNFHYENLGLPFKGELPNTYIAVAFWDHLIEEHLDITKTYPYHSQPKEIDRLIMEHTYTDKSWKYYPIEELNQNGQKWIFHLGIEPTIYTDKPNKRRSLNKIMREGFRNLTPSTALVNFFTQSAAIFLENSPFPNEDDPYADFEDTYADYMN